MCPLLAGRGHAMTAPRSLDEARRDGWDDERAACPCEDPCPKGFPPCTFEKPCPYADEVVSDKLRERYRSVA